MACAAGCLMLDGRLLLLNMTQREHHLKTASWVSPHSQCPGSIALWGGRTRRLVAALGRTVCSR